MMILHIQRLIPLAVALALLVIIPLSSFAMEVDPSEDEVIPSDAYPGQTLPPVGTPEPVLENALTTPDPNPGATLPPVGPPETTLEPETTPEPTASIVPYEVISSDGYEVELQNDEMYFLLESILESQKIIIALMLSIGVVLLLTLFCREWIK